MPAGGREPRGILLVTEQVRPGGKRSHVEALLAGLEATGWPAALLDWRDIPWLRRASVALPFRLGERLAPGLGHRWLAPAIARAFYGALRARVGGTGLIHIQEAILFRAARRAAGGRPVVVTVHGPQHREVADGYGLPLDHPTVVMLRELEREAYAGAQAVVSVDQAHARYVRELGRDGPVHVITNFVDTRVFHPAVEPQPFPPEVESRIGGRAVVLCPRRLVPKTGVDVAVRAIAALRSRGVPVALVVAGDGPQRAALEALVRESGAEDSVFLLGGAPHARLPGWCRRADVVVVPSVPMKGVEEATSISVLEAQATARPVIASALGGLLEIVEDDRTGVLVPPGDADALADALTRLLTDAELSARLGDEAARWVAAEHSHVAGARRFAGVYAELGLRA